MATITREAPVFADDNIFQVFSGLPPDLRRWNIAAWAQTTRKSGSQGNRGQILINPQTS